MLQEPQLPGGTPVPRRFRKRRRNRKSNLCVCVCQELLSLCGGDLSSALPWLELHTLNFSYNYIVGLDQSLVRPEHTHTHASFETPQLMVTPAFSFFCRLCSTR